MTLTNNEINEKIGELKGYLKGPAAFFDNNKREFFNPNDGKARENWSIIQHWLDPKTQRTGALPDWAGDMNIAVTLMRPSWSLHLGCIGSNWYVAEDRENMVHDKSSSRAICLAWLKSQEIEIE